MAAPLDGVRILDFTWVVAGPVATRILADQGAEVIKVERKVPGFMGARRIGLQGDLNRGKRSVAINMANDAGVELARKLAAKSDLVMDNFSARVMRQWGMDYRSLAKVKPDIICISMSGLGHTGPRSNYVSYGPTLQALSGFTQLMARENGEPAGFGYSYADMAGGYTGALAALIALWSRKRTGRGQFVDLSQFESIAAVIGPALLDISANQRAGVPPKYRSQEGPAAPHGVYRCKRRGDDDDRWVAISVRNHSDWRRFVVALGSPDWTDEPRFLTLYTRMQHAAELDERITEWTSQHDAEEVMMLLQRAGIAAGIVSNGADLCERDAQLRDRKFWSEVKMPEGKTTRVTGIPFRIAESDGAIRRCAPEIGEDNGNVLGEILGLNRQRIAELEEIGAVWP